MENIIPIPKKVAVIFFAGDPSIADKQYEPLRSANLPFEVVPYFRHERQTFLYQSYSQMFNDFIDETEEEFMIFANPKTVVSSEDVEKIVNLLCSGFCFVGVFGIAFCGFTKELIRKIGMMDEAFLGSEFEDNDILIRIRQYGKAVHWGQDWSKYEYYESSFPPIRGCGSSHFWNKWRWKEGNFIDSHLSNLHKTISKRHSVTRNDISSSWYGFGYSWGEGHIWDMATSQRLIKSSLTEHIVDTDMQVNIEFKEGNFRIELLTTEDTALSVVLTSVHSDGRIPLVGGRLVYANTWISFPIQKEQIEMRLWHDKSMIYMNTIDSGYNQRMNFRLPSSILL